MRVRFRTTPFEILRQAEALCGCGFCKIEGKGNYPPLLYSPGDAEALLPSESGDRKRIGNNHLHAFRRRVALNNLDNSREYHPGSQVNTGFLQRLSDSGQPARPSKAVNSCNSRFVILFIALLRRAFPLRPSAFAANSIPAAATANPPLGLFHCQQYLQSQPFSSPFRPLGRHINYDILESFIATR